MSERDDWGHDASHYHKDTLSKDKPDMPEELWAARAKTGSHYWTKNSHDAFNKDNCFGAAQTKYIRDDIHKVELAKRDEVIKVMREALEDSPDGYITHSPSHAEAVERCKQALAAADNIGGEDDQ